MAIRVSLHFSLVDIPTPPDEDAQLLPYLDTLRDAVRLEVEGVTAWCDAVTAEGEVVAGTESLSPRERAWRAYHYAVALLLTHATPTSGRCKGLFLHLRQGLQQGLDYPPLAHQLEQALEAMKAAPAPVGTTVVTPRGRGGGGIEAGAVGAAAARPADVDVTPGNGRHHPGDHFEKARGRFRGKGRGAGAGQGKGRGLLREELGRERSRDTRRGAALPDETAGRVAAGPVAGAGEGRPEMAPPTPAARGPDRGPDPLQE